MFIFSEVVLPLSGQMQFGGRFPSSEDSFGGFTRRSLVSLTILSDSSNERL